MTIMMMEWGKLTVPPPFLIHSHYLPVKALQSASIIQSLHKGRSHTVNAPETRVAEARWETRIHTIHEQ